MFQIDKSEELTTNKISDIISAFQTSELPKLKHYRDYYDGKQKILQKTATDTGKPCNKIVVNYCYNITENYQGYLTGIPIRYNNENLEPVLEILNYNDVHKEDNELLRSALIYGKSYEICYVDEEGKQRFRALDSRECIPVYDNTLTNELLYVIRFWQEERIENSINKSTYIVEVYGQNDIKKYKSNDGFSSLLLIEEIPHHYGMCPITVFSLNEDEVSIFDKIITLQDGYNQLISDEVDDFDAFADAYLVLKGVTADDDDLDSMKTNRVLIMDPDASAEYLTKSISDTQITNMLQNFNDQIHKISNSPDFNDEKFLAQSGIAMKYKLVGFENQASNIQSNMTKALQRRLELICNILSLTDVEAVWRDVDIIFTRNLPLTLVPSTPQELMQYKGLVSDETLLSLLPFINDVKEELLKMKAQTEANMSLYNFNINEDNNE